MIESDSQLGGTLGTLHYLKPPAGPVSAVEAAEARTRYFSYLGTEFGRITLEGLPADVEVGSRQLKLEHIYIPSKLIPISDKPRPRRRLLSPRRPTSPETQTKLIGDILEIAPRLAILAAPGGGKSTLLKRLAVAYAFPERRAEAPDRLPPKNWFPLIIRCRQLGALVSHPIREILASIAERAEMPELKLAFDHVISAELRNGSALLLVDGLDEIADSNNRIAFVEQLRTFLAMYPTASIVLTCREAGFRIVAGSLAAVCEAYRLAEFDDNDIRTLTVAWHKEVVDGSERTRQQAEELADSISATDRVRQLARNPLLLTTLLLVKRWVGELPRKRTVLYAKAIEVLLMTWNVEGHAPLDQEEAIPQLAYVAFAMTAEGVQNVSIKRLTQLLTEARKAMPEILGYSRLSVGDFINSVEERSSLLSLSGHLVEDGVLRPFYEFKHLTFQEYLAAVAAADGYLDRPAQDRSLSDVLRPYFLSSSWREVIPLAAVLAGRGAARLVEDLLVEARTLRVPEWPEAEASGPGDLLLQCLADEAILSPDLVRSAIEYGVRTSRASNRNDPIFAAIAESKYGSVCLHEVREQYGRERRDMAQFGSVLGLMTLHSLFGPDPWGANQSFAELALMLASGVPIERAAAAMAVMCMAFQISTKGTESSDAAIELAQLGQPVALLLESPKAMVQFAAAWALAWLGRMGPLQLHPPETALGRLFELWRTSPRVPVRRQAAWAFRELPSLEPATHPLGRRDAETDSFLEREWSLRGGPTDPYGRETRRQAALIAALYLGGPWDRDEIARRAETLSDDSPLRLAAPLASLTDTADSQLALFDSDALP